MKSVLAVYGAVLTATCISDGIFFTVTLFYIFDITITKIFHIFSQIQPLQSTDQSHQTIKSKPIDSGVYWTGEKVCE